MERCEVGFDRFDSLTHIIHRAYKIELKPEQRFLCISLSGLENLEDNKDVTDRVLKV